MKYQEAEKRKLIRTTEKENFRSTKKYFPEKEKSEYLTKLYELTSTLFKEVFGIELEKCIINLNPDLTSGGSFSPNVFVNENGQKTHELSLHPLILNCPPLMTRLVLFHQQVHGYLYQTGLNNENSHLYHGKQFSDTMSRFGIITSANGKLDGASTGAKIQEIIKTEGLFYQHFKKTENEVNAPWKINTELFKVKDWCSTEFDNASQTNNIHVQSIKLKVESTTQSEKKRKASYTCSKCGKKVWGASGLKIQCVDCQTIFIEKK